MSPDDIPVHLWPEIKRCIRVRDAIARGTNQPATEETP